MDFIVAKYNYWIYILLMMIGLYAMISKRNLVKKIIGMNIFQTAIILFYVSIGAKKGGTIPILEHGHENEAATDATHGVVEATQSAVEATQSAVEATQSAVEATQSAVEATQSAVEATQSAAEHAVDAALYVNPLPHVLMLTAIVVSVATLGVALAIVLRIYRRYGTLEEDEILEQIR